MKICICTTPAGPYPTDYPPVGPMAIIQALRKIGEEASFRHIDYHRYSDNQNSEYFAKHQFDREFPRVWVVPPPCCLPLFSFFLPAPHHQQ